jgi:PAS domain S-box-containing protein
MPAHPDLRQTKPVPAFLQSGGEMGERTRSFDWPQTSLGPIDTWPQSLRTTLGIVLHSAFPMFLFWGPDLVCFYNEAFRPSLGADGKHPALGKNGREVWPEIWDTIGPLIERVMTTGEPVWYEDLLVPFFRNGAIEQINWTFSYSPAYGDEGSINGVFVTCMETTDKVSGIRQLAESEALFRNLLEETPVATALYKGPELILQYANDRMLHYWGKDASAIGKTLREAIPEIRDQHFAESMLRVFITGEPYTGKRERADIEIDGTLQSFYFNFIFKPLRDVNGAIYGVHHTAMDVTSEVLAHKKLEESEKNLRNTILQAPVAMCILKGPDNIIEVANERIIELWGATGRDVIGRSIFDCVPEVRGQGFEELLHHVYTTGETYKAYAVPLDVSRNGRIETVYIDFVYEAYLEEDGSFGGVIAAAIDVTEQMTARMRLELAEEKVRMAVASADLGTYEIDMVTSEITASDRFNQLWGTDQTLTRAEFVAALHPDDLPGRDEANRNALTTGGLTYDARVRRKDGTQVWVRITGRLKTDAKGEPNVLIGIVQDITEQKLFAEELRKQVQERTAELERKNAELQRSNGQLEEFAHAASHDLKEPIRKIHFFTDMLKKQLGTKLAADDERIFGRVEQATKRMNSLIDDLLLYSHVSQKPHEKQSIDLNEKIARLQEDLELDISEKHAIIQTSPLPVVQGYRRQLQQLFHNLFTNALKYSHEDRPPRIRIEADTVPGEEAGLEPGTTYHRITVTDNGIGFEQEHADRIFQMFQRLHGRNEYKGTGVGLSIVRKVAENHQGKITAEGKPGEGARFTLYLPAEQGS